MTGDTDEVLHGKFITFEGMEGTGKTTQIRLLQEYLHSQNVKTVVTREPGGTQVGEQVRDLLLEQATVPFGAGTELLLMFAARAQHLEEVIYPALQEGVWVVCDRFTDASYAYQGGGRGIPDPEIQKIESAVHENFKPDLTILLTCTLGTAMQRISRRGEKDRFERESPEFFKRVQSAYLRLAENNPERFAVIDAEQGIEEVASRVQQTLDTKFPLQGPG